VIAGVLEAAREGRSIAAMRGQPNSQQPPVEPAAYDLGFFDVKGVSVPAAVSVFARELYQAPRSWTERAYPNLVYFNEVDRGGHFAAWEQPQLFTEKLRAAFRSLR
jgi:pimeloyl-ACP methyl ester carboxylesterase